MEIACRKQGTHTMGSDLASWTGECYPAGGPSYTALSAYRATDGLRGPWLQAGHVQHSG